MTEHDAVAVLLVGYIVEVLIALFAFYRIVRIYRQEDGAKSVLWRIIIRLIALKVVVGVLFVPIALDSLFSLPAIPFVGVIVTFGVMTLVGAVIVYWQTFEKIHSGRIKLVYREEVPETPSED